jgi:glycolate oxidase iron-sulfur subunit
MSQSISDLAAHCIRCGFCLESCPTFVVTGKETESPRGRIYLIRSADAGAMDWNNGVEEHIDTCVGCRACETACPSGVDYGALLELAREKMESQRGHFGKKALLAGITKPGLLRTQLAISRLVPGKRMPALVSRFLTNDAPEADKPTAQPPATWSALNTETLPPVAGQVGLLTGCAMKVLYPRVHEATRRLLRRVGFEAMNIDGCCGALHAHNGYLGKAQQMADHLVAGMPQIPLIINSAGCGSFLKEHLADSEKKLDIFDISEFLFKNGLGELLAQAPGLNIKATYHDACHLAHGQGIRSQPRELLKSIPGLQLEELNEADMCCGSGGIYNLTQPRLARQLLDRKWSNVENTTAEIIVTGNPGCHAWIAQAATEHGGQRKVFHTAEILEAAFSGQELLL